MGKVTISIHLSCFQASVHLQASDPGLCLHRLLAILHVLPHGGGHVQVPVVRVETMVRAPVEAASCAVVEQGGDHRVLEKRLQKCLQIEKKTSGISGMRDLTIGKSFSILYNLKTD